MFKYIKDKLVFNIHNSKTHPLRQEFVLVNFQLHFLNNILKCKIIRIRYKNGPNKLTSCTAYTQILAPCLFFGIFLFKIILFFMNNLNFTRNYWPISSLNTLAHPWILNLNQQKNWHPFSHGSIHLCPCLQIIGK